jgi:hypothetical protein
MGNITKTKSDKHSAKSVQPKMALQELVEFLWKTKLKSRDSFKLILTFINQEANLHLSSLDHLISSLHPNGNKFFRMYIYD